MFWWKFDQRIKDIAKESDIQTPRNFEKKMDALYQSLLEQDDLADMELPRIEEKPHRMLLPFRYGVIVAGILCLLLALTPVSANLQGYWARMIAMDDQEKEQYVSELEEYNFDEDNYSRKFTVSESERWHELLISYEQGERFPTGEITYIDSEIDIQPGEICYMAENSTFYFPDSEMTDEQLLELIEFEYKRAYGIDEKMAENDEENKETDTEKSDGSSKGKRLDEEDAIAVGKTYIQKIYNRDVTGWNVSVKKRDSAKKAYNKYRITYIENKTSAEYQILVSDTDGRIIKIHCVYNGNAENVFKGLSIGSKRDIRRQYREVKRLAGIIDASKEIVSGSCEYFVDKKTNDLSFGIITFWLEYSDGTGLIVYYSLNSKEYYQINFIEDNIQETRESISTNFESSIKKQKIKLE